MTGVRFPLGTFPSTRVGCRQQRSPVAAPPSMSRARRSNRSLSQRRSTTPAGPTRCILGVVVPRRRSSAAAPAAGRPKDYISRGAAGSQGQAAVASDLGLSRGWARGRGARGRGRGRASLPPAWAGPGHARVRTRSHPGPPGRRATMGSILSRRIAGVEDIDIQANSAYRYPPKSGEPERPARSPGPGIGVQCGDPPCMPDSGRSVALCQPSCARRVPLRAGCCC